MKESHATVGPSIMASRPKLTLVTTRDYHLFAALDRCPLTVGQILKLSRTFPYPFTTERRVQERLAKLCAAGRVRRWQYATAGQGALSYYTLSPEGYCILHGVDAPPPRSHAFSEVGVARQSHTRCLADFLVHTFLAAHAAGATITDFARENALRIQVESDFLYPDSSFIIRRPDGFPFRLFVELDNVSERVQSTGARDSWQRKIRFYDAYQDRTLPERFHVLAVTTGTGQRVEHILEAARTTMRNPHRSLLYATTLPEYLAQSRPLTAPCFRDNCGRNVVLVLPQRQPTMQAAQLARAVAV